MAEDKQVRKYFENLSYGKNSLSSEIHGKVNQEHINKSVASAVRMYDKNLAEGNKETAEHFKSQIMKWSADLDNLKAIKEEYAMNSGSGKGGMSMYSNYTDQSFDRDFFTERGRIMIDEKLNFTLGVIGGDGGFWMDNVKFPIEMVFINDDKIVDIKKAKAYDKTSISPSVESNGNLEVNDGFCGDNNISVGNTIYRS